MITYTCIVVFDVISKKEPVRFGPCTPEQAEDFCDRQQARHPEFALDWKPVGDMAVTP